MNQLSFIDDIKSDLCYQYYLRDSKEIFDPFAGWGERHSKAIEWGKEYLVFKK